VAALDLSGVLIVQLGLVTRTLTVAGMNRTPATGSLTSSAMQSISPSLDGRHSGWAGQANRPVFEAKFMLPWSFSEEAAAEKHMAQLQHNMLVASTKKSVLSIINGGGKWVELSIEADPIYQTILIAAEKPSAGSQDR